MCQLQLVINKIMFIKLTFHIPILQPSAPWVNVLGDGYFGKNKIPSDFFDAGVYVKQVKSLAPKF